MKTDLDKYYDIKGLSEYSSLGVGTLRDYLKGPDSIPHFKLKGKILVKESEFDRWLEQFRVDENKDLARLVDGVLDSLRN